MRNTVIDRIKRYAEKDEKIFLITGDAGFGVLDGYKKDIPDRFLNMGVAEQNMISFAAGLGLAGYKVFVYNIVPFILFRCYEQVRNDICYQRLPVTLIGIGSGVTYAPQGITHYSVEDIAIARTLPNMVILSPADTFEAEKSAEYAYRSTDPVYIRLAKSGEPDIHKEYPESIAAPLVIRDGGEVALLFHGSIGPEVMRAVEGMEHSPIVISLPMVQPFRSEMLL
jgi:transketolase